MSVRTRKFGRTAYFDLRRCSHRDRRPPLRERRGNDHLGCGRCRKPRVDLQHIFIGNLVFIAPVGEFIFRGVIKGRLRESFGPIVAISFTSIGFALGHIPSYWFGGSDLLSVSVGGALLGIGAGGFILGGIYERMESLLIVSIIHGLLNSVGIVLALLALL